MLVFLIGFMASGKTTLGKKLSRKLSWQFLDIDNFIEEYTQSSIENIFKNEGEAQFRKYEQQALYSICNNYSKTIISTGGGTACHFDNMERMNQAGLTIYLKADIGMLLNRITFSNRKRPLVDELTQNELSEFVEKKLIEREAYYNQADIILTAKNLKLDDVHEMVKKHFNL